MNDTALLNILLENSGYKITHIADVLEITPNTLRRKLCGRTDFKLKEAEKLADLLRLTPAQREQCFFGTEYSAQCRAEALGRRYADDAWPEDQNQTRSRALRPKTRPHGY